MNEEIKDNKFNELKEYFDMFDRDKDGLINYIQLGNILRLQGIFPTTQDLKDMINNVDQNQDNLIEFNEFLELMQDKVNKLEIVHDLKECFDCFDKEGTGKVGINEFKHLMGSLGDKINEDEINEMLKCIDPNNTGEIIFDNFINTITS